MPAGAKTRFRAGETLAIVDFPSPARSGPGAGGAVLLAHGAGGHKDHKHILDLSALLAGLGLAVVRFDFPYRARGKGPPDRMPRLAATVSEVAAGARRALAPRLLLLAGHSMGGRACSLAAAEGLECDGLILFSYPWHPPGKPDRVRTAHLARIPVPVLAVSGTRDAFCGFSALAGGDRLAGVSKALPRAWTQAWLEHADHGLDVARKPGRTREDALAEAGEACRTWLGGWSGILTDRPGRA